MHDILALRSHEFSQLEASVPLLGVTQAKYSPAFDQPSCRATVRPSCSQLFTRTTNRKHRLVRVSPLHYATILLTNNPAREAIAANARTRPSPFRGATTAHLYGIQYDDRPDAIHNFRPLGLSAPPVTIYHPVFARFLQRMDEEPGDLRPEDLCAEMVWEVVRESVPCFSLSWACSSWRELKDDRRERISASALR